METTALGTGVRTNKGEGPCSCPPSHAEDFPGEGAYPLRAPSPAHKPGVSAPTHPRGGVRAPSGSVPGAGHPERCDRFREEEELVFPPGRLRIVASLVLQVGSPDQQHIASGLLQRHIGGAPLQARFARNGSPACLAAYVRVGAGWVSFPVRDVQIRSPCPPDSGLWYQV